MENDIITLNEQNLKEEHICCAISDKKCVDGYNAKKGWLHEQLQYGFTFKKLNVRHKVFIEYGPAEHSFEPVDAPGYHLIHCFWVAGSHKGKGHARRLYEECEKDSLDKNGIVVVCGDKKRPFLADKKFFNHMGFEKMDTAPPFFELWGKKLQKTAPDAAFSSSAKRAETKNNGGLTVFYSSRCPYTDYYVNQELVDIANSYNLPVDINYIGSKDQSNQLPVPFSIFSLFYKGRFITHELLTKKRFDKLRLV